MRFRLSLVWMYWCASDCVGVGSSVRVTLVCFPAVLVCADHKKQLVWHSCDTWAKLGMQSIRRRISFYSPFILGNLIREGVKTKMEDDFLRTRIVRSNSVCLLCCQLIVKSQKLCISVKSVKKWSAKARPVNKQFEMLLTHWLHIECMGSGGEEN